MTSRLFAILLLTLAFQVVAAHPSATETTVASPVQATDSGPTATLRAASGATTLFKTQNGRTVNDVPSQALDLPHLVLYRNGVLTAPAERTLTIEVTDIEVPSAGVTVTLTIETQHGNPARGGGAEKRIVVWRESQWIPNSSGFAHVGDTAVFSHQFDSVVVSGTETMVMPTDYYRYEIAVTDVNHPIPNPLPLLGKDYAFLMESQWTVRLPQVGEESDGAAPDELLVYYCDMFPFQRSIHDPSTWLPREDVPHYVHTELIPQMVEAFRVQTDDWGFPWYQAWTGYRSGEDATGLSVALSEGRTWFHGSAPSSGNSSMAINVKGGHNAHYETLTDGLMSTFYHELFHNLQRNISQNSGGDGVLGGREDIWQFFSEGMAVLASSVGQRVVQFAQTPVARAYMSNANYFAAGGGLRGGDLNQSLAEMSPYHSAMYWRFLYEQCGGMRNDVKGPAAGMGVMRRALTAMYSGEIVDANSSTELVENLPLIVDDVLSSPEGSTCPFTTYRDSLIHFARALYALRLEGGRCTGLDAPAGCWFYDPYSVYRDPPISTIPYAGTILAYTEADQSYPAGVRSSFGMDFVDVILDPTIHKQTLEIEFHGAPGRDAEFSVQLWKLVDSEGGERVERVPTNRTTPDILEKANPGGPLFYAIPVVDLSKYNRLGLIITRLDARESSDPIGAYTIVLRPAAVGGGDEISDDAS